jgi:PAS domain S-box-containing protein
LTIRVITVGKIQGIQMHTTPSDLEEHYRAALEALPAAIYTTDAAGRITFCNEAAVELAGRRPELGSDRWCVSWRLFKLDGTPLRHDECPMAIALKENRPIRGAEAIAERPDGSRVHFMPYPTPLHDHAGKLIGAVNLLIDVTEQRRAEADSARLAAIVDSSEDAIISKSLDGRVASWNAAATRILGYEAAEMIGQPITRIIPPELLEEETMILARLRRGERIEHFETVRATKDGRRVYVSLTVSPVRDRAGRIVGASKILRDITERKRAEETQELLVGELNHRVKNTLATVQSVAAQTLRQAQSPSDFVPSFLSRIQALASTHTLLTQSNWQGADVTALVQAQLFVDDTDEERIACSGPQIILEPQLALHLAMVLHELGTNARKHGALVARDGRISVSWAVEEAPVRALHLRWREAGVRRTNRDAPPKPGFGTLLIERSMRSVEGGEARMCFEADGISWNIRLPLPASTEPRALWGLGRSHSRAAESGIEHRSVGTPPVGKRILVIEDEPLVAMDMSATLGEGGFEVLGPVAIVDEALRLIARADFDAVLLDANLGGKPVDALAAALTRRNIPFAFVTGYGRESLPRAFAAAPMLAKPFAHRELLNTTRRILAPEKVTLAMRRGPSHPSS